MISAYTNAKKAAYGGFFLALFDKCAKIQYTETTQDIAGGFAMKAIVNGKLVFPDRIWENGVILIDGGKIIDSGYVPIPEGCEIIDAQGAYVGPGLFDIHCHGYAQAGETPVFCSSMKEPGRVAYLHMLKGTTSITPTMGYSSTPEDFLRGIRLCNEQMEAGNTSIEGIHFEGPYINPNFGSHSDQCWRYEEAMAEKILAAAKGNLKHCTYAPEMPGAERLEEQIVAHGAVPAIGHTAAAPEDVERAKAKGAKIVTHLFDAMGSWRGAHWDGGVQQDSAALIALAVPGLYYELICDSRGIHVPPYCARLALRTAGEDHIILITDCVTRVSHNPNDYPPEDKRSASDLNFNEVGGLSGSRLVLAGACANFIRYAGGDVRTAFKCASTNPAKALRLDQKIGSILPGRDANILFVDEKFTVQKIIFRGEEIE